MPSMRLFVRHHAKYKGEFYGLLQADKKKFAITLKLYIFHWSDDILLEGRHFSFHIEIAMV